MFTTGLSPGANTVLVLPSASRVASTTSPAFINRRGGTMGVFLLVTVSPGGGETLTLTLRSRDVPTPLAVVTQAAFAYLGTPDGGAVLCGPGVSQGWAAGFSTGRACPPPFNYDVLVTHSAAGAWTYTVQAVEL